MPDGAQAWKLIKPPGSHTDRISQACDRCRSKKIRCDGKRPHCSQCAAVGFECRTSDRLSRRAFPRGYTESLEDRVRQLESENQKLVGLLDIKDEQLEMVARVDALADAPGRVKVEPATPRICRNSHNDTPRGSSVSPASDAETSDSDSDKYTVQHVTRLTRSGIYMGASAGGAFITALEAKLTEKRPHAAGQLISVFDSLAEAEAELEAQELNEADAEPMGLPPRMTLDRLVTVLAQEWLTVFPIMEGSEFLATYTKHAEDPENFDPHPRIQVILGAALAALGSPTDVHTAARLHSEWHRQHTASRQADVSIPALQSLLLAQLYSLYRGDHKAASRFRALAVNCAYSLGLHRPVDTIRTHTGDLLSEVEICERRRLADIVFVLDCFTAGFVGIPRLWLNAESINNNTDTKEEKIETTKTSSSETSEPALFTHVLALAHLLAEILDTGHNGGQLRQSYRAMIRLDDKLECWFRDLPPGLRFAFVNGTPTAGGPGSALLHPKAPVLGLLYHYARILVHLPAVAAPTATNASASAAVRGSAAYVAVVQSARTYLQIGNYLHSRRSVPTVCWNPSRGTVLMLLLAAFGAVDYSKGGALLQEMKKVFTKSLAGIYAARGTAAGGIARATYAGVERLFDELFALSAKQLPSHKEKEEKREKPKTRKPRKEETETGTTPGTVNPSPINHSSFGPLGPLGTRREIPIVAKPAANRNRKHSVIPSITIPVDGGNSEPLNLPGMTKEAAPLRHVSLPVQINGSRSASCASVSHSGSSGAPTPVSSVPQLSSIPSNSAPQMNNLSEPNLNDVMLSFLDFESSAINDLLFLNCISDSAKSEGGSSCGDTTRGSPATTFSASPDICCTAPSVTSYETDKEAEAEAEDTEIVGKFGFTEVENDLGLFLGTEVSTEPTVDWRNVEF